MEVKKRTFCVFVQLCGVHFIGECFCLVCVCFYLWVVTCQYWTLRSSRFVFLQQEDMMLKWEIQTLDDRQRESCPPFFFTPHRSSWAWSTWLGSLPPHQLSSGLPAAHLPAAVRAAAQWKFGTLWGLVGSLRLLTLEPMTTDNLSITSTNISLFPPWKNTHTQARAFPMCCFFLCLFILNINTSNKHRY